MDRGVYALVFSNRSCSLRVGSLGETPFRRGWHVYIGSARGPGGFARVSRHRRLALSRDRPPTWHVDHLLLSPFFLLRHVVCGSTEEDLECALALTLGGKHIPSFGSGDCCCRSHLFYRPSDPLGELMKAMSSLGLTPVSATLKKE
jgi:Uri superfamily endonuclease